MAGRIQRSVETTGHIPVIGKIKIGERKTITKNGKKIEIPSSLDYFRFEGNYAPLCEKTYGQPKKLQIMFVTDDITYSCNERYEYRQGSKLMATSDGVIYEIWDPKTEQYVTVSIEDDPDVEDRLIKQCGEEGKQPVLTLRFMLSELKGVLGVFQFSTRGKTTRDQIVGAFDTVMEQAGTVVKIPFDLTVEKVTSQKPGSKHSFPIVKLIPNMSQPALEILRDALASGANIRGMLTDEKVEQYASDNPEMLQISHKATQEAIEAEMAEDEDGTPGLFQPEGPESHEETDVSDVNTIIEMYRSCDSFGDINDVIKQARGMGFTEDEWSAVERAREDAVHRLREDT